MDALLVSGGFGHSYYCLGLVVDAIMGQLGYYRSGGYYRLDQFEW